MIPTGNHKRCFRYFFGETIKGIDHEFEALVGSPLSECENSMYRGTAHREIRKFRTPGENSVRAQMNVIATIFVVENLAVSRHQN